MSMFFLNYPPRYSLTVVFLEHTDLCGCIGADDSLVVSLLLIGSRGSSYWRSQQSVDEVTVRSEVSFSLRSLGSTDACSPASQTSLKYSRCQESV